MHDTPTILDLYQGFTAERREDPAGPATRAFFGHAHPFLSRCIARRLETESHRTGLHQDLAQKAWLRILRSDAPLRATTPGEVYSFLRTVANNLANDYLDTLTKVLKPGEEPTRIRLNSLDVRPEDVAHGPVAHPLAAVCPRPSQSNTTAYRMQLDRVRRAMTELARESETARRQMRALWLRGEGFQGPEFLEALYGEEYRLASPERRTQLNQTARQSLTRGKRALLKRLGGQWRPETSI